MFLFFIIIFGLGLNKVNPSEVRLTFLAKETLVQEVGSVLVQRREGFRKPNLFLLQDNSLLAVSPPRAVGFQTLAALGRITLRGREDVQEHFVKEGESLGSIAEKFQISLETILWANNLENRAIIQPGQKLIIPPVTGVLHLVRSGDTVSQIAQIYGGEASEIISFNNLSGEADIFIGRMLVIPDGRMPIVKTVRQGIPLASSYFIMPLSGALVTQWLHWYNAIDFATGRCGDPVYAAAGGIVQQTNYRGAYGYYVQILHPNGVATLYAHLSRIIVSPGQRVSQGQTIGHVGYTGHTIPAGPAGCHLHFEVRGARNPFLR